MGDFVEKKGSTRLDLKLWAKLLPFFKPESKSLIISLLLMVVSAAVDVSIPLFTSYAVNNFVVPQTVAGLPRFIAVYVGFIAVQALTTIIYSRLCMKVEMNTGRIMKRDCFVHLQKLPLSFYNTTSVGYILARVMSDTSRVTGIVAWGSIHMFWNLFYLIGMIIAMFALDASMALAVICVIPVIVVVSVVFQPRVLRANREMRRANSQITSLYNENINGSKTSKTLVIEDKITDEFKAGTQDLLVASLRSARLTAIFLPIVTFLSSVAIALVLYYSGSSVISGALDFGILSAFIAYAIAILEPVSQMSSYLPEILGAQVNIERIMTLLNQPVEISDRPEVEEEFGGVFDPKPENWPDIKGDIEFRDVWFKYPDAPQGDNVLEGISLKIPAGTTVAIVGETGAGKSTFVNLLCRFYEPTSGSILIDGADYRERSQIWLHSNLGYVQQAPHLFSGTIADNIRYGKLNATHEDIIKAARLVSADVVAERHEKGYDTDVGEGGDLLSTGEKQLVSFARAIIANPPIFVLDEATSSIDTETEQLIQNAISHVLEGRTSFIIAHRLSTIRSADLILLIEGHAIAEKGSHEELMARRGKYHALYTAMMIKDESE